MFRAAPCCPEPSSPASWACTSPFPFLPGTSELLNQWVPGLAPGLVETPNLGATGCTPGRPPNAIISLQMPPSRRAPSPRRREELGPGWGWGGGYLEEGLRSEPRGPAGFFWLQPPSPAQLLSPREPPGVLGGGDSGTCQPGSVPSSLRPSASLPALVASTETG